MNTTIQAAAALAAAACLATALAAPPSQPLPEAESIFRAAQAQYEANRWRSAYAGFVRAAALGHCEAARIAHQMHRYGARLYGVALPPPATELAALRQAKSCDASFDDGWPAG
jgi:hypothetical protein